MSASMAEGIAEVLTGHVPAAAIGMFNFPNGGGNSRTCLCGERIEVMFTELSDDESSTDERLNAKIAAHQAAVLAANGYGKLEDAKAPEVRYATLTNGETELDEVVAFNAYVHLEIMADNHWWMKISAADTEVDVNLYTKRAKITATEDTYRRPE